MQNMLTMKFLDYENTGDHIEYKILVTDPNKNSWQLNARYSRLREIHRELKVRLGDQNIPEFPPKRFIGNTAPSFVSLRQMALENYFNTLLKKYQFDQLGPLKSFLYSNNKNIPEVKEEPRSSSTNTMRASSFLNEKKEKPGNDSNRLEQIVQNYTGQYYSLKDTPDTVPPDVFKSKRIHYQQTCKIDVGPLSLYRLPEGNNSNLITVQDPTLISERPEIGHNMKDILKRLEDSPWQALKLPESDIVIRVK